MKTILIYSDAGASSFCIRALKHAIQQEEKRYHFQRAFIVKLIKASEIMYTQDWMKADLIIFPGGRDSPYQQALSGAPNAKLVSYVENGGRFLGICAGSYYGAQSIKFEIGTSLEIQAKRELHFFPGIAVGPAYGCGRFQYGTEAGARLAQLSLDEQYSGEGVSLGSHEALVYFNGGPYFLDAEKYTTVTTLARYSDIEKTPSAIVECKVGNGIAILSGVHIEYSSFFLSNYEMQHALPFFSKLHEAEEKRKFLFSSIFKNLLF